MPTLDDLLDLEAIRDLRIKYSHYFDAGEVDRLVDLFTDDAVCEFGEDYGGDWVGRETIRQNYVRYHEDEPAFRFLHATTNHLVELRGADRATGRAYLLDLVLAAEGQPLQLLGIYDDDYVKQGGEWRIALTRIDFLWPRRSIPG